MEVERFWSLMKRMNIRCPYCGAQATLRPASVIYGSRAIHPDSQFYICSRWPACDSYVRAHKGSRRPMGELANGDLRHKRIEAHQALEQLQRHWKTNRRYMYQWLAFCLGTDAAHTHIAQFREYRCEQTIRLCQQARKNLPFPPPIPQENLYEKYSKT